MIRMHLLHITNRDKQQSMMVIAVETRDKQQSLMVIVVHPHRCEKGAEQERD